VRRKPSRRHPADNDAPAFETNTVRQNAIENERISMFVNGTETLPASKREIPPAPIPHSIGEGAVKDATLAEAERFWDIRAANYDRLFWTKDVSYVDAIVKMGALRSEHTVLDVGTGTGTVAREIRKVVDHVVAVDISESMLSRGDWTGISAIKWDIGNSFFAKSVFDRVFARMVFHHIVDNLDRAVLRCYDLLKPGGRIIVAEGVPPNESPTVVNWFTEMFRHKEDRLTFTEGSLRRYLTRNGFRNVGTRMHTMCDFSVRNWLVNSGLPEPKQEVILALHRDAPAEVKASYDMRFVDDDCLLTTRNAIVVGTK
jgi:ubiquinone/menaquinone biosynthesis C-methylase UbiE